MIAYLKRVAFILLAMAVLTGVAVAFFGLAVGVFRLFGPVGVAVFLVVAIAAWVAVMMGDEPW